MPCIPLKHCWTHSLGRSVQRLIKLVLACRTLVRLYPMSPAMADQWLVQEISRGACDPGALGVFRRDAPQGLSLCA